MFIPDTSSSTGGKHTWNADNTCACTCTCTIIIIIYVHVSFIGIIMIIKCVRGTGTVIGAG